MNRKVEDAARALNEALRIYDKAHEAPDFRPPVLPVSAFASGIEISVRAVVIREVADDQVLVMFTDNGAIEFGCLPAAAHAEWVSS